MKIKLIILMSAAFIPFLTGCASHPTALASVGPDPHGPGPGPVANGHLEVFTATQKSPRVDNDETRRFDLHTGYEIYDASGKSIKYVANHTSNLDEWPDKVALASGAYQIVAESTWCGLVALPVVIQNGKTTTVHLDDNWFPSSKIAPQELVFLPNGETVGWSKLLDE
jgi:hypothetical protein